MECLVCLIGQLFCLGHVNSILHCEGIDTNHCIIITIIILMDTWYSALSALHGTYIGQQQRQTAYAQYMMGIDMTNRL